MAALREVRVGVRLQVVLPADAGVGHDRRAASPARPTSPALRLPPEQLRCGAVEGVVAAELVAHLVRDVVDGEEVALRLGQAGAAAALVVAADDAEAGDAAAVDAERDVADVVVGGADELAEHGAVPAERRDVADVEVAGDGRSASCRRASKHGAAPHGPLAPVALASVSRLSLSVSLISRSSDREVVVVDLVDPVDQRDLLGEHVGGAEVGRVRRVRGQREAVESAASPASARRRRAVGGGRRHRHARIASSLHPPGGAPPPPAGRPSE